MALNVGDWVRYSDEFCDSYMTEAGRNDARSRRGRVVQTVSEGQVLIDWGDIYTQAPVDSHIHVVTEAPAWVAQQVGA